MHANTNKFEDNLSRMNKEADYVHTVKPVLEPTQHLGSSPLHDQHHN